MRSPLPEHHHDKLMDDYVLDTTFRNCLAHNSFPESWQPIKGLNNSSNLPRK